MMSRRLFSTCLFIVLLQPALGQALNEPANSLGAQSAPVSAIPAKPVPPLTAPAKPSPSLNAPPESAPVPAKPPVTPAPAKPAPVTPVPAKPAPVTPVPVKPAPVLTAPAEPVMAQSAPIHSLPPLPAQPTPQPYTDADTQVIDIEIFVREDCSHCEQAKIFLAKLKNLRPQLTYIIRDVRKEPAALELLKRMTQNQEEASLDYPAFVLGGELIIGFSEEAGTARQILDTLASNPRTSQHAINCETGTEPDCGLIAPAPAQKRERININLFGHSVPLVQIGLPLFTIAMGLLDGLNHGSTWALILMISLLAPLKNRMLMFSIAGTFVAVQGLAYFILMAAWLNLFQLIEISRSSLIAIAGVALLSGAAYLRKYIYFGQRLAISSHEISKPGIYTQIRQIVQAKNLFVALLGTIILAILVQIGEFTFTSVFPALYTQVLTLDQPTSQGSYGYLLLYNFAYMLDDIIVLTVGLVTISQCRHHEKKERVLKLISSLAMAGVAAYLLLNLYWLA